MKSGNLTRFRGEGRRHGHSTLTMSQLPRLPSGHQDASTDAAPGAAVRRGRRLGVSLPRTSGSRLLLTGCVRSPSRASRRGTLGRQAAAGGLADGANLGHRVRRTDVGNGSAWTLRRQALAALNSVTRSIARLLRGAGPDNRGRRARSSTVCSSTPNSAGSGQARRYAQHCVGSGAREAGHCAERRSCASCHVRQDKLIDLAVYVPPAARVDAAGARLMSQLPVGTARPESRRIGCVLRPVEP